MSPDLIVKDVDLYRKLSVLCGAIKNIKNTKFYQNGIHCKRGTEKMAPEKMAPEKMTPEKMAPGKKGTRKKWHYVNLERMAPQEKMSAYFHN